MLTLAGRARVHAPVAHLRRNGADIDLCGSSGAVRVSAVESEGWVMGNTNISQAHCSPDSQHTSKLKRRPCCIFLYNY
jgi:hypothetical protein